MGATGSLEEDVGHFQTCNAGGRRFQAFSLSLAHTHTLSLTPTPIFPSLGRRGSTLPRLPTLNLLFFFIILGLELSDTQVYEP